MQIKQFLNKRDTATKVVRFIRSIDMPIFLVLYVLIKSSFSMQRGQDRLCNKKIIKLTARKS